MAKLAKHENSTVDRGVDTGVQHGPYLPPEAHVLGSTLAEHFDDKRKKDPTTPRYKDFGAVDKREARGIAAEDHQLGMHAAAIGRALVEGRITLEECDKRIRGNDMDTWYDSIEGKRSDLAEELMRVEDSVFDNITHRIEEENDLGDDDFDSRDNAVDSDRGDEDDEVDEDPLEGDVDKWVHPDETMSDDERAYRDGYELEPDDFEDNKDDDFVPGEDPVFDEETGELSNKAWNYLVEMGVDPGTFDTEDSDYTQKVLTAVGLLEDKESEE